MPAHAAKQGLAAPLPIGQVHPAVDEIFIGRLEVPDEIAFVPLAIMNIAAQLFQAHLLQPVIDHVEGCPFLTDEKYALPPRRKICNEIGDRLALACSGRTLDDIAVPGPALQDGPGLSRVRTDNMEPIVRPVAVEWMFGKDAWLISEKGI